MYRLFVSKPLVMALGLAFSGSVVASDTWQGSQLGQLCRVPNTQASDVAHAQSSGGVTLPENVTRITADKAIGQTSTHHRAQGNVIVERNQDVLNANWIDYDQPADTVRAGDTFTLTRESGQTVSGSTLTYHLHDGLGDAQNAQFSAEQDGRRLQGVGRQLLMHDKQNYTLHDVKFNTCQPQDTSWYVQAAELKANRTTGIGVAKHVRLVFAGIPVLYTPWVDFPINGNRKSGFLVPTLSVGSDGTNVQLPYYFNFAPNLDATLAPGIITERGAKIGSEFRYLQPRFSGSLNVDYMPDDKKSRHNNRSEITFKHLHRFGEHLTGGIEFKQVSDDDYYRDFYGRNEIAENVNLNRQLWLDYQKDWLGQPLTAQFLLQKYQTLSDANGIKDKPYAIMPRLAMQWQKNIGITQLNFNGQLTHFNHDSKQSGTRLVFSPSLKWNLHNQWGYILPKIGVHATRYWLSEFRQQESRKTSRVLPIVNVDSGITLEREVQWFNKNYVQTIEPRLFYNYIPSKSQNDLPNFDSSENDFSYNQLFRENVYSGNDRINASNSLAMGVQTRILNHTTGQERFRAGVGQKYYFSGNNMLLNGEINSVLRHRGDFVAFAGGQFSPNWFGETNLHWNQNDSKIQRFDAGVRYNPQAGKVLSARFKYGRNEEIYTGFFSKLKHVDLAAQWPLSSNVYAVGRVNYSLSPSVMLEQTAGFEYKNPCGCWSVSMVGQRYVNGLNSHKTAFYVTLQLKDISSLGNDPYEQLRLGIPGYTKTNEVK